MAEASLEFMIPEMTSKNVTKAVSKMTFNKSFFKFEGFSIKSIYSKFIIISPQSPLNHKEGIVEKVSLFKMPPEVKPSP